MSSTQTPSRRGSKRAWRAEANSSPSRPRSFWLERPIVTGAEFSRSSWPSATDGLFSTVSVPLPAVRSAASCFASGLEGASTKLSCGSRRSRAAVRTILQMNR